MVTERKNLAGAACELDVDGTGAQSGIRGSLGSLSE